MRENNCVLRDIWVLRDIAGWLGTIFMPKKKKESCKTRRGVQLLLFDDRDDLKSVTAARLLQLRGIEKITPKSSRTARIARVEVEELADDDMLQIWLRIRRAWFPERIDLDSYQVRVSRRKQKRTLASCDVYRKRVTVARELAYTKYLPWLQPLLYHEMCHAVLGEISRNPGGRRSIHGAEFKALEVKHPGVKELNQWIAKGGWLSAVRSDPAKRQANRRG